MGSEPGAGVPPPWTPRQRWLLAGLLLGLAAVVVPLGIQMWALMMAFQDVGQHSPPELKAKELAGDIHVVGRMHQVRRVSTPLGLLAVIGCGGALFVSRRKRRATASDD